MNKDNKLKLLNKLEEEYNILTDGIQSRKLVEDGVKDYEGVLFTKILQLRKELSLPRMRRKVNWW